MKSSKIDALISFDTTGSMYPVLAQVRREVKDFVRTLFGEFDDLRIGIIAHGDYCDKDNPYTVRVLSFTRDEDYLCEFVTKTKQTYGGDFDECYELVLNVANDEFERNGREDADKLMIMIGDATPHGVNYPQNTNHFNWKLEAENLGKKDVKIFSVHALPHYRRTSKSFYEAIADLTGGIYLTLDQFNEIVDLIKATCYQQYGEEKFNEYVTYVKSSGRMTRSMNNNLRRLQGEKVEDDYEYAPRVRKTSGVCTEGVKLKDIEDLVPVTAGRFQTMVVDKDTPIKEFVEYNGITFKKGRGFYELTKAETVQQYKEVIMQDRETGEMFTGAQVRKRLGLSPQSESGGVHERLHKADAEKFRVFVQSTSYNRKLIHGTIFLYEVDDLECTGSEFREEDIEPIKSAKESKISKKAEPCVSTKDVAKPVEKKLKKEKSKTSKVVEKNICNDSIVKLDESIGKVKDGISRYNTSANKKNTTFLANNLKKLIKQSQAMLDSIE